MLFRTGTRDVEAAVSGSGFSFCSGEYLWNPYSHRERNHRKAHLLIDDIPIGSYSAGTTLLNAPNRRTIPEHQQSEEGDRVEFGFKTTEDRSGRQYCAESSVNFEKLKRAGEGFPRTPQHCGLTRRRVSAERSALAAVGRRPPPQRHTNIEAPPGGGGVGGAAPHVFASILFAEL